GRLPKGPRIGFVTNSGATVDLLYDYAEAERAAVPDFAEETKAALLPLMQEGITPRNPLDVGIPSTLEVAAKLCETAARDPNIDMVAWTSPMPRTGEPWGHPAALRPVRGEGEKKRETPSAVWGGGPQEGGGTGAGGQRPPGSLFRDAPPPPPAPFGVFVFRPPRRAPPPPMPPPPPPSDLSPATL